MKITCVNSKLKEAVENCERIISRNLTLPILNNIFLRTEKNKIVVSSTNLEVGIRSWFTAKIEEEGEVTVPAKVLAGILTNLSESNIELKTKKETMLGIVSGKYRGELNGQNPKDFPIIPYLKKDQLISFEVKEFSLALSQVIPFTAVSETRPEITGVLFQKEKNQEFLSLVATDSFRLAERKIYLKKEYKKNEFSFILPQRTATEILRLLTGKNETRLVIEPNQVGFETESSEIISRLIEGNYPNYSTFIPKEFKTEIVLNRDELIKNIRLVSLLSSRVNDIHLKIEEEKGGSLTLWASDPDLGENTTTLPVKMTGEPIEINFNWRYLIEGLQNIEGKEVQIKFTDVVKPTLIKSVEDPSYIYIVMPIRA